MRAGRAAGVEVTIGEEAHHRLARLQALLAHQIPDGDPAAIVERALAVLLEGTLKKKAALTAKPRARRPEPSSRTRHIPSHVRREVWARDQGRCAFVGEDGHRCDETRFLEFAHADPWAKGGEHSVYNIGLRCRAHNALEANRDYGRAFMTAKRARRDGARESLAGYASSESSWSSSRGIIVRRADRAREAGLRTGWPSPGRLLRSNTFWE